MTDDMLRTTVVGYAPKPHLNFSGLSSTTKELFQTHKHLEKNSKYIQGKVVWVDYEKNETLEAFRKPINLFHNNISTKEI